MIRISKLIKQTPIVRSVYEFYITADKIYNFTYNFVVTQAIKIKRLALNCTPNFIYLFLNILGTA